MKENILKDRSFQFSLAVIKVYKQVSVEHKEYVLTKQLLRSGTAIGALYREAEHAQSKIDFIHKLSIALKEANETLYWIELLHQYCISLHISQMMRLQRCRKFVLN